MHRLIFWGIVILIVVLIGVIIDQLFWRTIRLLMNRELAMRIRLVMLTVTIVTIVGGCLYGHYITRLRLDVNEIAITSDRLPASFDGFRIAQISDFHIDSFDPDTEAGFISHLADEIKAAHPDIVVFTGDLVTLRSAQVLPWKSMLHHIAGHAGAPVYAILGNHDYADYSNLERHLRSRDRDSLCMIVKECGWTLLNNEMVTLHHGTDSIYLVGVENIGEPPFSTYGDLAGAMVSAGGIQAADSTYTILLSHNPTHWRREVLPSTSIDLMLAGHTHAMQFRVLGWSPSKYAYPEYSGLYTEGQQHLYVNTGLGCTGPRVRIGVRPELSVIELKCNLRSL